MIDTAPQPAAPASPSSRRAWIEMSVCRCDNLPRLVALLAEGVDRNVFVVKIVLRSDVALLAEGVDRNIRNCAVLLP